MVRNIKISLISCVILLALSVEIFSKTRYVINHHGGYIADVRKDLKRSILLNQRIFISGICASACTIYLYSENTCVTETTEFLFHQAQTKPGIRILSKPDSIGNNIMLMMYPIELRDWINKNGGLPWLGWLKLSAKEAVDLGITKYCHLNE